MGDRICLQRCQKESGISRGSKQSTFTLDTSQRGCGRPADQGRIILQFDGVAAGGSKYDRSNPGTDLQELGSPPVGEKEKGRRKWEKSKKENLVKRERECVRAECQKGQGWGRRGVLGLVRRGVTSAACWIEALCPAHFNPNSLREGEQVAPRSPLGGEKVRERSVEGGPCSPFLLSERQRSGETQLFTPAVHSHACFSSSSSSSPVICDLFPWPVPACPPTE